jgi:hypothetical protein
MRLANFIIAGTEKAGTTSVFSYLAGHPQVATSRRKETNFFRSAGGDPRDYARQFADAGDAKILLEASPAYLGEAASVAPRMRAMLPDVKLLFILREPIDRFLSSYHFHHARLNLPSELSCHEYLQHCLAYAADGGGAQKTCAVLDEWYLKVLPFGRYTDYLQKFFAVFPREQLRITFYDDLRSNPAAFMMDLSGFLDIDPHFWVTADFEPQNVTFSARLNWLHKIAIVANDRLEAVLRPRPRLKANLLGLYQRFNRAQNAQRWLSAADRASLEAFYASANRDLESLLGIGLPDGWIKAHQTGKPRAQGRPKRDVALTS